MSKHALIGRGLYDACIRYSERLESVECTDGILKKIWRILKSHMLIRDKTRIDSIVFTCTIMHTMLIEHDNWEDDDDDDDIAVDIADHCMDERIIDILNVPVYRSYAGSGNIMQCDVEVESEWAILRANLIQNYMHCFRENRIEW